MLGLSTYFYLNETIYNTDGKKVSTALTYFKIGTSAGKWARDRQQAALNITPINFGSWADFQAEFKKQFIPAHTALEATKNMYTSKMHQQTTSSCKNPGRHCRGHRYGRASVVDW